MCLLAAVCACPAVGRGEGREERKGNRYTPRGNERSGLSGERLEKHERAEHRGCKCGVWMLVVCEMWVKRYKLRWGAQKDSHEFMLHDAGRGKVGACLLGGHPTKHIHINQSMRFLDGGAGPGPLLLTTSFVGSTVAHWHREARHPHAQRLLFRSSLKKSLVARS